MFGFLDLIAPPSQTIQMDFITHKEVIKYTNLTNLSSVDSFEDLATSLNQGLIIDYIEAQGDKVATAITLFDYHKLIPEEEFLSHGEFLQRIKNPALRVYDVRPLEQYSMGHIPGAMLLPLIDFEAMSTILPMDKTTPIIFSGTGGGLGPTAALTAKSLGYTKISVYAGGFPDWVEHDWAITSIEWLKSAIKNGTPHVLIDLRSEIQATRSHLPGSVNLTPANFRSGKTSFPEEKNAPIILYGPERKKVAATLIDRGYRAVTILPVSFETWQAAGYPVETGPTRRNLVYHPQPKSGTISVEEFARGTHGKPVDKLYLDVRNPEEFAAGSIPEALNFPVDRIGRLLAEIPAGQELILFCASGTRAEMAHTILDRAGRRNRYLNATVNFKNGAIEIK
ncbi:MAG: hypothetical protein KJ589_05360 [Proteobacteria bacterium]|nr:hypothetical protein [Pseudomonadota bacterium]